MESSYDYLYKTEGGRQIYIQGDTHRQLIAGIMDKYAVEKVKEELENIQNGIHGTSTVQNIIDALNNRLETLEGWVKL